MFNFLFPKESTLITTLFTLFLYVIIVVYFIPVLTKERSLSKSQRNIGKFLVFLFLIFPMWGGDFFSYYNFIAKEFPQFNGSINALAEVVSVEEVYLYIAHLTGYDYLVWRIIVFGGMLAIGLHIGKRLDLNQDKYLACFALFSMFWLSYARASLAMAIGFLGMTYLVKPISNKKFQSFLLGLLLLFASLYFHKSAIVIPGVVLLSMIRINKWKLFVLLLALPLVVHYFQIYATEFVMDMSVDESSLLNVKSAQGYLSRERGDIGIAMAAMEFVKRIWMYAVPFISIILIRSNKYHLLNSEIQKFLTVDIIIIVFASLFFFIKESLRLTFVNRFMYYSLIPVAVIMCSLFEKHYYLKFDRLVLYTCIFSNFLYIFYSMYLAR